MAGRLASVTAPTGGRTRKATRSTPAKTQKPASKPALAPQPTMARPKLLLSQEEAAAELGIGLSFFEDLRDDGLIHVVKVGRLRKVAYAELVRFTRWLYAQDGVPLDELLPTG